MAGSDPGVSLSVPVPPQAVFDVLADGWSYAGWVVGASHIREVDEGWPAKGTRIHHSIGPWPLVIEDSTEVLRVDPPSLLVLEARMWPVGKARVRFELTGDDRTTTVKMYEMVIRGPLSALPSSAQSRLIAPRNRESLRRLARLAQAKTETD
ncbi:SRPBCC family protein [Glycomyces sp. TRM65418]|uniref:SRPBCC family protein n=1 Tax=Glycomyces sp. TRM65418 TaxID=2867006 RepID=UPI001CE63601|nr:SRPBCC family protein [Glycomyces sp. TRM65418]MCC3763370.1 SRPBCC family protein [Glycomyces sp. TRM65418]QZD57361.1 SRPBCC family protein [Glycomyces sp. TRM65418]